MSEVDQYRASFEKWVSESGRSHLLTRSRGGKGWYEDLTVTGWWAGWCGAIKHIQCDSGQPIACGKCQGTGIEERRFHGVWPDGEECIEAIKCDNCDGIGHIRRRGNEKAF